MTRSRSCFPVIPTGGEQEQDQTFEDLQKKAQGKGLAHIRTPAGYSFAPMKDGELLDENQIKELPEEERERLESETKKLQKELQKIIQKMPSNRRKIHEEQKVWTRKLQLMRLKNYSARHGVWPENGSSDPAGQ